MTSLSRQIRFVLAALIAGLIGWASTATAQQAAITDEDVVRLIGTLPSFFEIFAEYEAERPGTMIDDVMTGITNPPQDLVTRLNAMVVSKGYDSYRHFGTEVTEIVRAFAFLRDGGIDGMVATAIKTVEADTTMTDAQKNALLAQIAAAAKSVPTPDQATLDAVAPHVEAIEALLKEDEQQP